MQDPIVEEIRRIREEHAAEFNYDLGAIFADLKRLEAESGRPRVSFGPRRVGKPILPSAKLSDIATKQD
jgi:hypothetical protein